MTSFVEMVNLYQPYWLLIFLSIWFVAFVYFYLVHRRVKKLLCFYQNLLKGQENQNLEELLAHFTRKCDETVATVESLEKGMSRIGDQTDGCLQKVNIHRFDAFEDMGGQMSFSLALLNQENTGLIISNIYARSESHVYIRNVVRGKADCHLLPEEELTLQQAKQR